MIVNGASILYNNLKCLKVHSLWYYTVVEVHHNYDQSLIYRYNKYIYIYISIYSIYKYNLLCITLKIYNSFQNT
jgi:hypothetical protein